MGLGGVISNLLSLGAKLLPAVVASAQAPSSSSSLAVDQNHQIEAELQKLMRTLKRIKVTLYDAEQREITDLSVNLWLKELKGVVHDAEDVLGEYHYEVLRAQVEARDASPPDSRKRKLIQVPCGMLDQIQQIRGKFDEIAHDRIALQLTEGDGPKRCNSDLQIDPTSNFVVQSNIFGREREKEKLIDLLSSKCDVVSVVTIVGTGGIGKTTLAQLAYNDERIKQRFDKIGWICASEDFNVVRLTRESIESITGKECGLTNLGALQKNFQEEISGERVLFVLDDVWNENKSLWDSFQAPFMSAAFVKILVTTRNDHVAQIMQTEPTFNLGYLSDEQCWQLFEHYAFGGKKHNKGQKLVEIGKQIMSKCGMLPLAVKAIASLLRYEAEEENWNDILESELWGPEARNKIFPPLQISYVRLPTHLKSCFLYCSMFPKDYCYDVEYLVKLWMYQGFIQSKGNKTKEKIGFEYAQQLCQRSLFEREGRYEGNDFFGSKFKLHDIVHDLARYNSENGCYSIEVSKLPISPNVVNHLYIAENVNLIDPISSDKFTALRTLITCSSVKNFFSIFDHSMPLKLRALEIRGSHDCKLELLSSIGILKHLRYLSISNMFFETLPECICSLYSLQNLTLKHSDIKELPTKIQNLISLEELMIDHYLNLAELPESLCQIKALRKLFISSCDKIKVLPNKIGNLVSLEELRTENCDGLQELPESLCQIKALRKLFISSCDKIKVLPNKIGNLVSLEELRTENCDGLQELPESLCQIKALRKLFISSCDKIKVLPNNIGNLVRLEELRTENCDGLQELPESLCQIKALRKLFISSCDKIKVLPNNIGNLVNLEELRTENCDGLQELPESLCQIKALRKLFISSCDKIKVLPNNIGNLVSLEELHTENCDGLQELPKSLCQIKALRKLFIISCNKIKVLPNNIGNLLSLEELHTENCDGLQVLPESLCQLKALRKLSLIDCQQLKELPSDIGSLPKLQTLEISKNGVSYLPPSLSKFVRIQALKVVLKCENIEWLKNFPDLGGTLCLCELENVPNSMDLKGANYLKTMHYLEHLILVWTVSYVRNIDGSVFHLSIKSGENIFLDNESCFRLMDSLQPHRNLIRLEIEDYNGITFPGWIGSLCKLKYLSITLCDSLQFLKAESLPYRLEELEINGCHQLISMPGIQKLKSLVKLSINNCENLCSLMDQSLDGGSSLTYLDSLRILKISNCSKLQALGDELLPVEPCKIEVNKCPGLREWCLQHRISYKEGDLIKTEGDL